MATIKRIARKNTRHTSEEKGFSYPPPTQFFVFQYISRFWHRIYEVFSLRSGNKCSKIDWIFQVYLPHNPLILIPKRSCLTKQLSSKPVLQDFYFLDNIIKSWFIGTINHILKHCRIITFPYCKYILVRNQLYVFANIRGIIHIFN